MVDERNKVERSDEAAAIIINDAKNKLGDAELIRCSHGKDFVISKPASIENLIRVKSGVFSGVDRRVLAEKLGCEIEAKEITLWEMMDITESGQFDFTTALLADFAFRAVKNRFARLKVAGFEKPLATTFRLRFLDEEIFAVFFDEAADDNLGHAYFPSMGSVRVLSFSWTAVVSVRRVWRRQSMSVRAIFRVRFRTGSSARGSKKS